MKSLIYVSILLLFVTATDVAVKDQCDCAKLLSQADCKANTACSWSTTTSLCSKKDTGTTTTEGYCQLITDPATCAKTKGCAYVDSACSIYAGCSAYKGATDSECQAISKFCNSDGTAYCIAPGTCTTYKTQDDCTGKGSSAGTGTCVWESNSNTCREQKCTDADATLVTNAACNNFLAKCVTNGKGCVTALANCSTYTGDVDTCVGMIGTDGYCEGVEGKTTCQAKVCTNAETTLTTDTACAAYQTGCVTTGYGCVKSPLGNCSTLSGDDVVCANKKGSDGKCKGVAGGKSCSVVACTDAATSVNTDEQCDAYKSGCVTTGQGCIATRGACSSYQGTTDTCSLYVGSDGYCKGASDALAACSPKVCTGADSTLSTNADCNAYQIGCVTTGKGCVAALSTCSSYQGDSTSCDGYIGTDGKCKGNNSVGPCVPKVCTEAPSTLTTNEDCSDYQKGCIASGSGGCVPAGSCSTLLQSSQCDGVSTCQTASQCVQNVSCADLTTEILCKTTALQNGNTCWWVSGSCTARLCSHAANTLTTDASCDAFLKGCWTNGAGCVDTTATCGSYTGTDVTCAQFTRGCTGSGSTAAACIEKTCGGNTTATSDSACNTYKYGCVTLSPGTPGCIDATQGCSAYTGTSTDTCSKFKGNKTTPCWWVSGGNCTDKTCLQAPNTITTDADCETFLKGCVTTGAGCIVNTTGCSGYQGNAVSCLMFHEISGTDTKFCSRKETCLAEKTCTGISSPTSQSNCDSVLPGQCMFVKDRCQSIQADCANYASSSSATLSVNDCSSLTNSSGGLCYWSSGAACINRTCAMNTTATDLATCVAFGASCAKKTSGNGCEAVTCGNVTSASTLTEANCQAYHSYCHLKYDGSAWICSLAENCAAQVWSPGTQCSSAVTKSGDTCKQSGSTTTCMSVVCTDITVTANCNSTKIYLTSGNTYIQNVQNCFLYSGNCVARSCASAATHLGVANLTSRSSCSNYYELCVLSLPAAGAICVDGTTASASTTGCQALQGTYTQCTTILQGRYTLDLANKKFEYRGCFSTSSGTTVGACTDRQCNNIPTLGTTDALCQAWLSTCKTNGTTCIPISDACTTLTLTASGCANMTGIVAGAKCQAPTSVNGACASRNCYDNGTATTDKDCDTFLKGCITSGNGCIAGTTTCSQQYGTSSTCKNLSGNGKACASTSATVAPCADRLCTHNSTATTNDDCNKWLSGCLTTGAGCVDSTAACSSYLGTQTTCETFTGNSITCTNVSTATATTACINKDCAGNTTAANESDCQGYGKHCHYNGSGCSTIQTCAALSGNIVTCASYVASDGPCKGTALLTATPTSCAAAVCTDAPVTLTTDADCKKWKSTCITTGYGCMTSATCGDRLNQAACATHVNVAGSSICSWTSQCRDVPSTCSSFTASGQSVCLNANTSTGLGVCAWKSSACTEATCVDLPNSISSEDGCTAYSSTCTFSGAGCVVKDVCTKYPTELICTSAKSTDSIGTCTWDTTVTSGTAIVGCRAKNCTDAPATLITDTDCDAFIIGCATNGAGCVSLPTACSQFQTQAQCIKDSTLKPCLWYNNACIQYYECSSIVKTSVSECQNANKYCTTDGSKCTPLVACATYTKQLQCVTGTDGTCGWVTATKKCQLYAACTDISSKVNTECSTYNANCISNGTDCIAIAECATYADSQVACKLGGTDGTCFYDTAATACRLRQCSDATTSLTTHAGCYAYTINSTTKCTTSGSACISLAGCSTYTIQAGCVISDTGSACTWDTTAKACKDKTCSDTKKTKTTECAAALSGCISDGTTCIPKATCATYTTQTACQSGGTDGACAFTPASTGSTTGTCKLFSQCSDASSDQTACKSKSAACKWTAAAGTTASSCAVQTCTTAATGTKCVTVPSFDGTKYTVCQVQGTKCVTGDPSALTQDTCYKMSQYTYSWSTSSKKCVACGSSGTTTNDTNTTTNNTANTTTPTTTAGEHLTLVSILAAIIIF